MNWQEEYAAKESARLARLERGLVPRSARDVADIWANEWRTNASHGNVSISSPWRAIDAAPIAFVSCGTPVGFRRAGECHFISMEMYSPTTNRHISHIVSALRDKTERDDPGYTVAVDPTLVSLLDADMVRGWSCGHTPFAAVFSASAGTYAWYLYLHDPMWSSDNGVWSIYFTVGNGVEKWPYLLTNNDIPYRYFSREDYYGLRAGIVPQYVTEKMSEIAVI